jgi:hypothetical protein
MAARDGGAVSRPMLPGGPKPPRSCLDRGRSPTTSLELDAMRRRAWHDFGVATLVIDEIWDPLLRQAITNEAVRRWGQRHGGHTHGR